MDNNKVEWMKVSNKKKRVFLGGTCNKSTWRDKLIPKLEIEYYNPVVENWDEAAQKREIKEREICDFCLYVITPKMTGVYSIAEVIDDSNKRPEKTVFCFLESDDSEKFNKAQKKSLDQVVEMVEDNGATVCDSLDEVAKYLNKQKKEI